jgi:hypothetical protein
MAFALLYASIEVSWDSGCSEAEVHVFRSYCAHDVSQCDVTNDESECATLMAAWRIRFANLERVVFYLCSLTSRRCSTAPHELSPSHLSHAPSHLRGISSFDTSDNLSGYNGDASCASEIGTCRIGMLAAFSNYSDLAINFDELLEKYTSQDHLTPGADIYATTVLLRRDARNAASALDPINESTAAVPNIADAFAWERQVRSTPVDFSRANCSRYKNARVACLKTI